MCLPLLVLRNNGWMTQQVFTDDKKQSSPDMIINNYTEHI